MGLIWGREVVIQRQAHGALREYHDSPFGGHAGEVVRLHGFPG